MTAALGPRHHAVATLCPMRAQMSCCQGINPADASTGGGLGKTATGPGGYLAEAAVTSGGQGTSTGDAPVTAFLSGRSPATHVSRGSVVSGAVVGALRVTQIPGRPTWSTKIFGLRLAFVEKATGLWSLSVMDTVTGLRELSGYPPPTGARRDWPWRVGIQPGRIRPAPSRTTLPTDTLHRNPASPGPVSDGCYRFATWTRLEPPWS